MDSGFLTKCLHTLCEQCIVGRAVTGACRCYNGKDKTSCMFDMFTLHLQQRYNFQKLKYEV